MIKLTDNLYVDADEHCYIVGEPFTGKDGFQRMRNARYYSTFDKAVAGAIQLEMRRRVASGEITELSQFTERLSALKDEISKTVSVLT